ncbi:hypothetical protein DFH29DRAFT_982632 [Suillus ampliporus]|nr:hypothetical protein DFH29DRAFT_982632 [Suillus ampliporus]
MLNCLPCTYPGCPGTFWGQRGCTKHICTVHGTMLSVNPELDQASPPELEEDIPVASEFADDGFEGDFANFKPFNPEHQPCQPNIVTHPHLRGDPCDANGNYLPAGTPPSPRFAQAPDDWSPFTDQAQFLLADFLFCKVEMSAPNIDFLMELWAFKAAKYEEESPFKSYCDVYATIDTIQAGDVPWQCFTVLPQEDLTSDAPVWKKHEYQVWYRDPDTDGQHQWKNFMSGNYAWQKSDEIHAKDLNSSDGAMYCGIILGSNKTTVSVTTGHVEYHLLYLSIGNPHNSIHCAHRNAVTPIGFLAIPKSECKYDNDIEFRKFKRQLFHSSLAAILQPLWHGMMTPVVQRCPDGHYCRVIYDLSAFIADYPEQVMLAGIVQNWCVKCTAPPKDLDDSPAERHTCQYTNILVESLMSTQLWDQYGIDDDIVPFTNDFPRADIHEMLSPDLLHQVIKGCFKDHLVTWTCEYLTETYGEARANEMFDDIDRQIAAAPLFPGLHRFPHGCHFKQWTGDDSKALMKVYIPAIVDYVPAELVQCMSAFLDFCYLVRRSELSEETLRDIKLALQRFHETREIFRDSGVRPKGCSLPQQHSLVHYLRLIQEFGAPNGLCSSITESRHITAALGQMLLTNQRLDKLAAARVQLVARGMLPAAYSPPLKTNLSAGSLGDEDHGDGHDSDATDIAKVDKRGHPWNLPDLATHIYELNLELLTRHFLFNQLHMVDDLIALEAVEDDLPVIQSKISVFHSMIATFSAPSDYSRHDCVFIIADETKSGMRGMIVGRVKLFFSFMHNRVTYPCALVDRFSHMGRGPDAITGMWKVKLEVTVMGRHQIHIQSIEHIDTIYRAAHLLPVFGDGPLPVDFHFAHSLDAFNSYYVNKYADHHAKHHIVLSQPSNMHRQGLGESPQGRQGFRPEN